MTEAMKTIVPPDTDLPRNKRQAPETAEEGEGGIPVPPEAQAVRQPRPWWRRMFGG